MKHMRYLIVPSMALMLAAGFPTAAQAATGWQNVDGSWYYYDRDGNAVTDCWKKSGNWYFWLDSDGAMAADQLIEDNGNYYYVNEDGARVENEWRKLDNDDAGDDEPEEVWYYFGPQGKAYTSGNSSTTSFKTIKKANGTTAKYAFDENGKMLTGWVDDNSGRLTDDDAWKSGVYYLGDEDDGERREGKWEKLEVEDDENTQDGFDGTYWFYFKSNGKKTTDTTKKINGRKYRFGENGETIFEWYYLASGSNASGSNASGSNLYYNVAENCWLTTGWFKTVPSEDVDADAYNSGEEYWFYADKDGDLVTSQIKKINGQYYAFDEKGEMLYGVYKMITDDEKILSWEEVEGESDLPEEDDEWDLYYFGDSPKEGAMETGRTKLDIADDDDVFEFQSSGSNRGKGYHGIHDGSLYIKGKLMKADKDSKLEVVSFDGKDYLVNTSGKIQKKKTNVKDADDNYYCTDKSGIVTYKGTEKQSKED